MEISQNKIMGKREHVRRHLLDLISRQTIVGSHIKSEDQIARELGVSRSTVHGVLSEFARKGIVSRRPRAGTILRNPNHALLQQKETSTTRVLAFVALFPREATFGSPILAGADAAVSHSKFLFIYKHVYSSRSMYFYPSSRLTQNPHSSSVQNNISCNLDGMVGDLILLCTSIQNLYSSWHNSFPSPTSPHFRVKISRN